MSETIEPGSWEKWAHFRFAVVGPLLAAPPETGELQAQLVALSRQLWQHPITSKLVRFGVSTIERWYYAARHTASPVEALRRKPRSDKGAQRVIGDELEAELRVQYKAHPSWSCQLHRDNLVALVQQRPELLRILASSDFDSTAIATIVLCGDQRLIQQFRSPDLIPIATRIRVRLLLWALEPKELVEWLKYVLAQAGAPHLISPEVMSTLAQNSFGNLRALANSANELLAAAARHDLPTIDEKLYLETFNPSAENRYGTRLAQP